MPTRSNAPLGITSGALLAVLLLAACTGTSSGTGSPAPTGSRSPVASMPESMPPTPDATPPTSAAPTMAPSVEPSSDLGPFDCSFPMDGDGTVSLAQLTDARVGQHPAYDRFVFEFDAGIPAYAISEASPPFVQDPSGLPLEVEGSYVWQIILSGGTKMTPEGTSSYEGPTDFTPSFAKLLELVEGGDFEAVSSWYAGMSGASCIRVLTLDDPPRLVVDIEH